MTLLQGPAPASYNSRVLLTQGMHATIPQAQCVLLVQPLLLLFLAQMICSDLDILVRAHQAIVH